MYEKVRADTSESSEHEWALIFVRASRAKFIRLVWATSESSGPVSSFERVEQKLYKSSRTHAQLVARLLNSFPILSGILPDHRCPCSGSFLSWPPGIFVWSPPHAFLFPWPLGLFLTIGGLCMISSCLTIGVVSNCQSSFLLARTLPDHDYSFPELVI